MQINASIRTMIEINVVESPFAVRFREGGGRNRCVSKHKKVLLDVLSKCLDHVSSFHFRVLTLVYFHPNVYTYPEYLGRTLHYRIWRMNNGMTHHLYHIISLSSSFGFYTGGTDWAHIDKRTHTRTLTHTHTCTFSPSFHIHRIFFSCYCCCCPNIHVVGVYLASTKLACYALLFIPIQIDF